MTTIDSIRQLHPGISDQHAQDAAMVVDAIREVLGDAEVIRVLNDDSVFAFWTVANIDIHRDIAYMYYSIDGLCYRAYGKPTPEWAKVFAAIARLVKEDGR